MRKTEISPCQPAFLKGLDVPIPVSRPNLPEKKGFIGRACPGS